MDAPTCRTCHMKHWGREPCKFTTVPEEDSPVIDESGTFPKEAFKKIRVSSKVILLSNQEVKGSVKRWDRDSWNAYMKDYMKKRRAEKKHLSSNTMAKGSRAYKEDT